MRAQKPVRPLEFIPRLPQNQLFESYDSRDLGYFQAYTSPANSTVRQSRRKDCYP
jgi:hypothetical protein